MIWREDTQEIRIAHLSILSTIFETPLERFISVASQIDQCYISDSRKKSDGTIRQLYKPRRDLKDIQKKIATLLARVPVSDSVHGWVRGRSIKTAAVPHVGNRYLYHYDIDDYFDSIGSKLVYRLFVSDLGCSPDVGRILTRLSTFHYCLPQGSPCSPAIANLVLADFDYQMTRYITKRAGIYKRFGDNIIFSSHNRLPDVKRIVEIGLRHVGLKTNPSKEINAAEIQKSGIKVIGVVIGSRLTVPRKFRQIVRAIMHKKGEASSRRDISLIGKIRYIQGFHPDFYKV